MCKKEPGIATADSKTHRLESLVDIGFMPIDCGEPYRIIISEDPIRLKGGINFFAYANNNPVRFIDALGLEGCGPAGLSIPDSYGFIECCNDHDNCYGKCGGKFKCDMIFCGCLLLKCTKEHLFIYPCMQRAAAYCGAVSYLGGPFYGNTGNLLFPGQ